MQEEVIQEIPAPKQEVEKKEVKVLIECKTILNNMERLQNGYQSFIPQNGIILNTTSVEIKEGDTVLNVLKRVAIKIRLNLAFDLDMLKELLISMNQYVVMRAVGFIVLMESLSIPVPQIVKSIRVTR